MQRPIFILGYTCSGKTSKGKRIANKLNIDFLDSDTIIEKKEKKSISLIFQTYGEGYFRKLESLILSSIDSCSKSIISLGGGTPCYHDNILKIKSQGTSIFLDISIDFLIQRLKENKKTRPTVSDIDDEQFNDYIREHYHSRLKYYHMADFSVKNEKELENCIRSIMDNS